MLTKNYYKVSNEFADNLESLSGNAVKIYVLFKRMVNEEKNDDMVYPSYTYIQKKTGLSRTTISNAITELIESGWINAIDQDFHSVNKYHVNDSKGEINQGLSDSRQAHKKIRSEISKKRVADNGSPFFRLPNTAVQKIDYTSPENRLGVVQKIDTNNTNKTKLNNKTTDFSSFDLIRDVLKKRLHITCTERWDKFIEFVDKEEKTNNRPLSIFLDYILSDETFDIKKTSPSILIDNYPLAFVGDEKEEKYDVDEWSRNFPTPPTEKEEDYVQDFSLVTKSKSFDEAPLVEELVEERVEEQYIDPLAPETDLQKAFLNSFSLERFPLQPLKDKFIMLEKDEACDEETVYLCASRYSDKNYYFDYNPAVSGILNAMGYLEAELHQAHSPF